MPSMKSVSISELNLDLSNFRTVKQVNETDAINAIIAINSNTFWALVGSILDDGYINTENIILLEENGKYIVKEGNRRIAALKIVLRKTTEIDISDSLQSKIMKLSSEWKTENSILPCLVYPQAESAQLDKIIALIHAKGELAGRDEWNAVAHARHARDKKGEKELGLDLLEKYLINGKNLSRNQSERWSGDYPLSVLDETIQKLYGLLGYKTGDEFVLAYPGKNKTKLEKIFYDIGMKRLGFAEIRNKSEDGFFGLQYGIIPPGTKEKSKKELISPKAPIPDAKKPEKKDPLNPKAYAPSDPKSVYSKLRNFTPRGQNRGPFKSEVRKAA